MCPPIVTKTRDLFPTAEVPPLRSVAVCMDSLPSVSNPSIVHNGGTGPQVNTDPRDHPPFSRPPLIEAVGIRLEWWPAIKSEYCLASESVSLGYRTADSEETAHPFRDDGAPLFRKMFAHRFREILAHRFQVLSPGRGGERRSCLPYRVCFLVASEDWIDAS